MKLPILRKKYFHLLARNYTGRKHIRKFLIGQTPACRSRALRPYLGGTLARTYTDPPALAPANLAPYPASSACRIGLGAKGIRASGVISPASSGPSRSFVSVFRGKARGAVQALRVGNRYIHGRAQVLRPGRLFKTWRLSHKPSAHVIS